MKILVFPHIENSEKFNIINEKIKNVHKVKLCSDPTAQSSIDGVWKWEIKKTGKKIIQNGLEHDEIYVEEVRTNKKIWVDNDTLLEVKPNSKNAREVNDLVQLDNVEYKIHPDSKISLQDIEVQKQKSHLDFGNGMSNPVFINDKPCCIVVLDFNEDIDDIKFDKISKDITSP